MTLSVPGKGQSFDNAFVGMKTDPGQIAVSFYSGIFSYAGWWVAMAAGPADPGPGLPVTCHLGGLRSVGGRPTLPGPGVGSVSGQTAPC